MDLHLFIWLIFNFGFRLLPLVNCRQNVIGQSLAAPSAPSSLSHPPHSTLAPAADKLRVK